MKTSRQNAILNLIDSFEIGTQEELCKKLLEEGYKITQATVSRDIRELKLTKMVSESGKQKYVRVFSDKQEKNDTNTNNTIIKEGISSVETAMNMIVVKAKPGLAPAVGSAVDAMKLPELVGSIAGDDTLLCITKTEADAESLLRKFENMIYFS